MTGERARSLLAGTRFRDIRWVDETGSTNSDLLDLARAGAPEGLVVVADHQTAGRGRLGRTWEAPVRSSLLLSILLRPRLSPEHVFAATMAVGVSAAEACATVAGVETWLKWPNDLIVVDDGDASHKVGGMLTESVVEAEVIDALVVGIGINVNWPVVLPPELADIAASLNHRSGAYVDREELLADLLGRLDKWCNELDSATTRADLRSRYLALCATLGRHVRAELPSERIEGVAVDITTEGYLVIEAGDGTRRAVVAGDLVHLR